MMEGHRKANGQRSFATAVDLKLIACYVVLVIVGLCNIYASIHTGDGISFFDFEYRSGKQVVWIATAFILAALILFVLPTRLYESAALPIYGLTILLLIAVIFLGTDVKGSHSWFVLGPVSFQPAEISKIATSLMLAAYMGRYGFKPGNFKSFATVAAIILVPMLIIVAENETGSALVYAGFIFMLYREGLTGWIITVAVMAVVIFVSTLAISPYAAILFALTAISAFNAGHEGKLGKWFSLVLPLVISLACLPTLLGHISNSNPDSWTGKFDTLLVLIPFALAELVLLSVEGIRKKSSFKLISVIALVAAVALVFSVDFLFNDILQDHQRARIEVLLGMKEDPSGVGYNVNQSMIAIGSGGLLGKGFLRGTQTAFGFVPEQSTDFIFCTIGEEWGFVGSAFVILLYVFMIWRIVCSAEKSRETFTRVYGYCVAGCLFMHLFINIGMTIGLMPVIGIPLPLVSYGGSSLWSFTIMLFIFIALDRNENKYF